MGNCCGKSSSSPSDPFSQPGRRLDSAPPPPSGNPSASVPASARQPHQQKPKVGGPPRTLGGSSTTTTSSSPADDARRKAAEAAEARQKAQQQGKGKLQAQLNQERAKTRIGTLRDASEAERRHRDVDGSVDALRNA